MVYALVPRQFLGFVRFPTKWKFAWVLRHQNVWIQPCPTALCRVLGASPLLLGRFALEYVGGTFIANK